jgi:hypothetical protein
MTKLEELKNKVDEFKSSKEINIHKYNILLDYVILSLYSFIPPKRNQDYCLMNIVYKLDSSLPITNNYLDYTNLSCGTIPKNNCLVTTSTIFSKNNYYLND